MSRKYLGEICGGVIAGITVVVVARHYFLENHSIKHSEESVQTLKFKDEIVIRPYVAPKNWFERVYLSWELRDDVLNDGLASYSPPGWGLRLMKEIVIYYTPGLVFLFCAANDPEVVVDSFDELLDIREEVNEIVEEINHRYNHKTSVVLVPPPPLTQIIIESFSPKDTEQAITEYHSRSELYTALCEELADQLNIPVLRNFWSILEECTHSRDRQFDHVIGNFQLNTKTRIDLFKSINAKYLQPELPN